MGGKGEKTLVWLWFHWAVRAWMVSHIVKVRAFREEGRLKASLVKKGVGWERRISGSSVWEEKKRREGKERERRDLGRESSIT